MASVKFSNVLFSLLTLKQIHRSFLKEVKKSDRLDISVSIVPFAKTPAIRQCLCIFTSFTRMTLAPCWLLT